jgi:L-aminopeptidase/D-esterase-like protein
MRQAAVVCPLLSIVSLLVLSAQTPPPRVPDQPYRPGQYDAITDVPGVLVGHYKHPQVNRGLTVVIPGPAGGTCGADVRGSNPGTWGVSTYEPINIGEECDAIVLTGGSLWGYGAISGVMEALFEQGKGVRTRGGVLPVVPGAVIFDLPVADPAIRPNHEWGRAAVENAKGGRVEEGNAGVGAGATTGKLVEGIRLKGGLGTASAVLPDGTVVGVIVVLNSVGDLVNPKTGELYAVSGFGDLEYRHHHTVPAIPRQPQGENTTNAVIATNARLTKPQLAKIAEMAHDGLARAIRPIHAMQDGDTTFAVSVGWDDRPQPEVAYAAEAVDRYGNVGADLLVRAIVKAMNAAKSIPNFPSYTEWKKIRPKLPR